MIVPEKISCKFIAIFSYFQTNTPYFRFKNEKTIDYIKVPIEDNPEESLSDYIEDVCNFLGIFIYKLIS